MSFLDFMQVLDTTFPIPERDQWLQDWMFGLFFGELIAFLIIAFGVYYMSKKRVSMRDSVFIALTSVVASFAFGVVWWLVIGFW